MAVIRAFRHEVKGRGTRHTTDVDCLYFDFLDMGGSRILQLSTLGSDHRQSKPKVSQTFQIGAPGAAELVQIIEQTFVGIGSTVGTQQVAPARSSTGVPVADESADPIDRFVARAGLDLTEELTLDGSPARRRVLARDDRPFVGGSWYIADYSNAHTLSYTDVERDWRSAPSGYQRAAVVVKDLSTDLEQVLAGAHADVIRLADLGFPVGWRGESGRGTPNVAVGCDLVDVPVAPQHPVRVPWVEQLFESEVYIAQKALAGRATVSDDAVRDVVNALIRLGSSGPIELVEREAGFHRGALRPIVPLLRRLLNVDGYDTIAFGDEVLSIDEYLLRQQFGLSVPTLPEGGMP